MVRPSASPYPRTSWSGCHQDSTSAIAALIEPLAVAIRAIQRGGLRLGQRAHVIGAGPVGLLVASCARIGGASEVTLSEPAERRAAVAADFGAHAGRQA